MSNNRKPPIRKTRDSVIQDKNIKENVHHKYANARHREVRRDNDTIKNIGITLEDIDFSIKSFVENEMKLRVQDGMEYINVPLIYANPERWANIQENGNLRDRDGKVLLPVIAFKRTSVTIKNELRKNKVASTNQIGYVVQTNKYGVNSPYNRFSLTRGETKPREYFVTPIPDYVDVSYDFYMWTEYVSQMNYLIEQFIYYTGKSFGDRNYFKFSTNADTFSTEETNTIGGDRIVRCSFPLTVHAYLLPKEVSAEATTKRVITPNKIIFGTDAVQDIASLRTKSSLSTGYEDPYGNSDRGSVIDPDGTIRTGNEDFFASKSQNKSPNVYPRENK
ncbi:hypothetical protein [Microcystis phage Mel-JY01]